MSLYYRHSSRTEGAILVALEHCPGLAAALAAADKAAVEIEVAVVTVVVLLWHCPSSELAGGKTTDSVEHELVEGVPVVKRASLAEHPALVELRLSTKSPLVAPCHQVSQTTQCEVVQSTVPSVAAPSFVFVVVHFLSELLLEVASICEGSLGW